MPRCLKCGESLVRARRAIWEKALYTLVFKCQACEIRIGEKRSYLHYFARFARCPRCGTEQVEKRSTRDRIDKLLKTPVSLAQALLGGSLYHCVFCRVQFYDLRARARKTTQPQDATLASP